MKTLFRILIIATCIGIVYYYSNLDPSRTELLEGPSQITQPLLEVEPEQLSQNELPRPTSGISKFIGASTGELLSNYGKPRRVDQSAFGYEWWIYIKNYEVLMVGVEGDIVTQAYTNASSFDVTPYKIGQSLDDVYRMTIFEQEVTAEIGENIYMFAMNEVDMQNRILVKYEDVFAQLYIDMETRQLDGVRFIDGKTLVLHKPYELQFIGQLLEAKTPSSYRQMEINCANGKQLNDLTNSYRRKNNLPVLQQSTMLTMLADDQSEKLFLENMDSKPLEPLRPLSERLNEMGFEAQLFGENIATNYIDSIEVFHGWLNSKEHRDVLLNERFTKVGSGAFVNYYTQVYIDE
ncbi:CAP-associated domain-containing protein [Solibacillus sp. FSL R7-0682]|uniref:CAP domain-containing protein n=1 Tax=Solibacillus sp. FSL R7-0682 TaxID=2921690 RepID=UPI0030FA0DAA